MSNIDELSKDYAQTVTLYDSDTDWYKRDFSENEGNFKDVADYLFALPLSCRLTDAEKEKIRTKYSAAKIGATECDSPECAEFMDMLDDLFGKEFFEEDKP